MSKPASRESDATGNSKRLDRNRRTWVMRRAGEKSDWKSVLAHYVVSHDFVQYSYSLLLASGTTLIKLMDEIVDAQLRKTEAWDLDILTPNLQVVYKIRDAQKENALIFGDTQIAVTGGEYSPSLDALVGPAVVRAVTQSHCSLDVVFLGAKYVTFQGGFSLYYQFEDELPSQEAYATCSTTTRVLLVDHSKFGKRARRRANVSIETMLMNASICYVITTWDPSDQQAIQILTKEEAALKEQLSTLAAQGTIANHKDFVFRVVGRGNKVEREIRLSQFRKDAELNAPVLLADQAHSSSGIPSSPLVSSNGALATT